MGVFDFIWKRESEHEVVPEISDALLRAMLKNETITRDKAMMLPVVSAAVDYISGCVASMPVRLFKITDDRVEAINDDQRLRMLNGDTGDMLNGYQLKKAMVMDYLLGKGGYCFIKKKRNIVTGLYYVSDDRIGILKNDDPIYKSFIITVNGKQYKDHEFIKLLRNTQDGASGTGLVDEVSKAIEAAYQTMLFQLTVVKAGGKKKGFLKSQSKLDQDSINTLKKAWNRLYTTNEENAIVLNNGVEFQEASSSNAELQLNESKRTLDDQINNIFHIHADFDRTFKEAVYPIVKAFESALNKDLLLEKEKNEYYFDFDVREITKASMQERFAAYKIAKETGFLTINEIRKEENMNYIEGMDVINVGLGAVLYDTETGKYYTPNTDTVSDPNDSSNGSRGKEHKDLLDDDGELPLKQRYNPNHDEKGRFAKKNSISVEPERLSGTLSDKKSIDFTDSKGHTINVSSRTGTEFEKDLKEAKTTRHDIDKWRVDDYSHSVQDYESMQCYRTGKGSTVAITADGDIVSVCSKINADGSHDSGRALLEFAVSKGGTKLDSYDGNFDFYTSMGFEPVSWTEFNKEYAPPDWLEGRDLPEPIVFFKYKGNKVNISKMDFFRQTKAAKDYDEAQRKRDEKI